MRLNLVLPSVTTASLWTLATVLEIARRHTTELAQRQRLRNTMGLYFSPRVLEVVLANPGSMEPRRAEVTLLLTDLRNSTPLAERLGPKAMFELLNRVFEAQTLWLESLDALLQSAPPANQDTPAHPPSGSRRHEAPPRRAGNWRRRPARRSPARRVSAPGFP